MCAAAAAESESMWTCYLETCLELLQQRRPASSEHNDHVCEHWRTVSLINASSSYTLTIISTGTISVTFFSFELAVNLSKRVSKTWKDLWIILETFAIQVAATSCGCAHVMLLSDCGTDGYFIMTVYCDIQRRKNLSNSKIQRCNYCISCWDDESILNRSLV